MIRLLTLFGLLWLGLGTSVWADQLRPGYLELKQRDERIWSVIWKAPVIGGLATRAQPAFPSFCSFNPDAARLEGAAVLVKGWLTCSRPLAGAQVGLKGIEASFTDALVRIAPLDGPPQAERLTSSRPLIRVATKPDRWQVARTYLVLGIEHILAGYDHLLFVVALVLLLLRPWTVIKAATAFTIAHTITLAGTTMGLFGLAQAPVEATIALSIVFLAVEIAKRRDSELRLSERIPWAIAFLFGLLHGFGFAGALREIGLPEGDVPMALLTFNVGVEIGQLLIITSVIVAIELIRRIRPALLRPATITASYAIGTIASYWFIERMMA